MSTQPPLTRRRFAELLVRPIAANGMFAKAEISISTRHRARPAHRLAEVIAMLGLILVILALARTHRASSAPAAVGAYIGAAYFFTSSASFGNPADDDHAAGSRLVAPGASR